MVADGKDAQSDEQRASLTRLVTNMRRAGVADTQVHRLAVVTGAGSIASMGAAALAASTQADIVASVSAGSAVMSVAMATWVATALLLAISSIQASDRQCRDTAWLIHCGSGWIRLFA